MVTDTGDFDKDALRKAEMPIIFNLVSPDNPAAWVDCSVRIEARAGNAWRVYIFDTDQLGENICHVDTITADTTNALELVRISLNAYRAHRGPVRPPEQALFTPEEMR